MTQTAADGKIFIDHAAIRISMKFTEMLLIFTTAHKGKS